MLAILLPMLVLLGLSARQPPLDAPVPAALSAAPEPVLLEARPLALPDLPLVARVGELTTADGRERGIELTPVPGRSLWPDAHLYWRDHASAADPLLGAIRLGGPLRDSRQTFLLPAEPSEAGLLLIWSVARGEVVATIPLDGEPKP